MHKCRESARPQGSEYGSLPQGSRDFFSANYVRSEFRSGGQRPGLSSQSKTAPRVNIGQRRLETTLASGRLLAKFCAALGAMQNPGTVSGGRERRADQPCRSPEGSESWPQPGGGREQPAHPLGSGERDLAGFGAAEAQLVGGPRSGVWDSAEVEGV